MWSELKEIAAIIANADCVYLRGPIGSGKTFLAHNFQAELLTRLKEQSQPEKIFVLYQASLPESTQALFTIDGKDQGWQNCAEALLTLRLLQHKKKLPYSYHDVLFWCEILRPRLQDKEYQFTIILDDYDEYRQGITAGGLKHFNELKKQNVRFVLTGTKPITDFYEKDKEIEIDFLADFNNIDISLPTLEEAEKIAQDCWKNKVGSNAPDLQKKHLSEIVQIAGNYPLLIDNLVSCFADSLNRSNTPYDLTTASHNLMSRMDENLEFAASNGKFLQSLQKLWESLTKREKETMQLLALDQKVVECAYGKDIFETWLNRSDGNIDEKREEAEKARSRLRRERLLLFEHNRRYKIASRALFELICHQPETKELANSLDFKMPKRKQFSTGTFFALMSFISAPLFLIFFLILHFWRLAWPKEFGFIVWLIPIFYYLRHLWRADSNHRNLGLN